MNITVVDEFREIVNGITAVFVDSREGFELLQKKLETRKQILMVSIRKCTTEMDAKAMQISLQLVLLLASVLAGILVMRKTVRL